MTKIITMYITLFPPIIAGILNMVWCKLPILKKINKPIDAYKIWKDNKRVFGDNKTWKGLIGYIVLNILVAVIWGEICKNNLYMLNHNYFYIFNTNTLSYNILIGFLLGLSYSLFELPNSFLKRRLEIGQSKDLSSASKIFFIFLDQADSVIGCALVTWLFYDIGILTFLEYILLGALTHIIINMLLFFLKLRKNMF